MTVRRFFADTHYVNRTAAELGECPELTKEFVPRFFRYACGPNMPQGRFGVPTSDYTCPIVSVSTAAGGKLPWYQRDSAAQDMPQDGTPWSLAAFGGVQSGDWLPWSGNWLPAPGNDLLLEVLDEAAGTVIDGWMIDRSPFIWNYLTALDDMARNGWAAGIGMGTAFRVDNIWNRGDDPKKVWSRGCGLPKLAGTTRVDEVLSGEIRHALSVYIANPMFGPATAGTDWRKALSSITPATSTAPKTQELAFYCGGGASRLEHLNPVTLGRGGVTLAAANPVNRAVSVPSGMRFALRLTRAQVEAWAKGRGYTGARYATAVAFGWAMVQYGWEVSETCGPTDRVLIEFEGFMNRPADVAKTGLKLVPKQSDDLMDGLANEQNTYVVMPLAA